MVRIHRSTFSRNILWARFTTNQANDNCDDMWRRLVAWRLSNSNKFITIWMHCKQYNIVSGWFKTSLFAIIATVCLFRSHKAQQFIPITSNYCMKKYYQFAHFSLPLSLCVSLSLSLSIHLICLHCMQILVYKCIFANSLKHVRR